MNNPTLTRSHTGVVKVFNKIHGFGFITDPDGTDYFVHMVSCKVTSEGGVPVAGDTVSFDLEPAKSASKAGQMQCCNVTGGSGLPLKKGGGANQGQCKSFDAEKGWGFIVGENDEDIFFHAKGITDHSTPTKGDWLSFDLEESKSKPGQMVAENITGGTGWGKGKGSKGAKGGGKDWGKGGGKMDQYGPSKGGTGWNENGWTEGSWGGGKGWGGGPYDGGKGKDGGKGGDFAAKGTGGMVKEMLNAMLKSLNDKWGGDSSWSSGADSWSGGGKGGGDDSWKGGKGGKDGW